MRKLFENWRNFLVERARYVTSIKHAYKILGLQPEAENLAVKKAYRKLALQHHPDRGGDELIFREVGEAYDAIMNPKEPRWYAIGGASQDPAGSEPTTSVNVVEYMRTMPGGSQILKSLQEISAKVKEAIEKGQSIKREGTRLPAPIVIDGNNFNNFEAFVTLYSWREARDRIMVPPFIKERMLSVWKTTPFNGKLDKELLGHFQNWLRQFESEPEATTQQPEPEATILENWREYLNEGEEGMRTAEQLINSGRLKIAIDIRGRNMTEFYYIRKNYEDIWKSDSNMGSIYLTRVGSHLPSRGPCSGAWTVGTAKAEHGWGPLLYDIAMEWATKEGGGGGIMTDREGSSGAARRVWDYYLNKRNHPDITIHQLDDLENTITPEKEDNCQQPDKKEFDQSEDPGMKADTSGTEWMKSARSKRFTKKPTTLDKLEKLGLIIRNK